MKVDIAGVEVDKITNSETLEQIKQFVRSGQPHYLVTAYSEFIVFAQNDPQYRQALNRADLCLPDGIGILWAAKYLSLPLRIPNSKSQILKKGLALWQVVYTGASLIFNPKYCRAVLPEQVTGRKLVWDIAQLASENNFSIALVGGMDDVARLASEKLKSQFPSLKVNLALSDFDEFNDTVAQKIQASNSDILLIAYQPPKQEQWLAQNLPQLNVKVAMGLGGTFDYLAGKRAEAPELIHHLGVEWLWRLVTQPWRLKRIWNAIIVFIRIVYRYKVNRVTV
jgi:N-acetylglucosaminyldiphosphoundecaprenol N-acetyl-beta-D-mannosaminyltransferase